MSTPDPAAANTERRPLPQYGEYAPPGYVSPVPVVVPRQSAALPEASHGTPTGSRPRDATITVVLLGLGSAVTTFIVMSAVRYDQGMQEFYTTYDLGTYTPTSTLVISQVLLIVSHVAALGIGAAIALRKIRRGHTSFWVPLVAGAIAALCYFAITVTLILSDAKLTDALMANPLLP